MTQASPGTNQTSRNGELSDYKSEPQGTAESEGAAAKLQGKASEVGGMIADQADASLGKAAEGLGMASEQIRQRAQEQGGIQAQLGGRVADGLDKTSDYLETRDTAQVIDDVEAYVKAHPMAAVAGAVVGGFVLSRILR